MQYVPPLKGDHLVPIAVCAEKQTSVMFFQLEVRVADLVLQDRFLWDINDPGANPEAFAKTTVSDLGLPLDFVPAISLSIR